MGRAAADDLSGRPLPRLGHAAGRRRRAVAAVHRRFQAGRVGHRRTGRTAARRHPGDREHLRTSRLSPAAARTGGIAALRAGPRRSGRRRGAGDRGLHVAARILDQLHVLARRHRRPGPATTRMSRSASWSWLGEDLGRLELLVGRLNQMGLGHCLSSSTDRLVVLAVTRWAASPAPGWLRSTTIPGRALPTFSGDGGWYQVVYAATAGGSQDRLVEVTRPVRPGCWGDDTGAEQLLTVSLCWTRT